VNTCLDKFQVLVRRCRALQPDGYEITLEVRRRDAVPTQAVSQAPAEGRPEQRDDTEEARRAN
jgi:hypothetical protein